MLNWFRKPKVETRGQLSDPEPWLLELFGAAPTYSGVSIGPQSAMRVPAVAAPVGLISGTVANLPCKVFRREANGGKEPARDHPAYALVHRDANPWTSAAKLREQLTIDALLRGHGVAFANNVNGRVRELIRLAPEAVAVEIDEATTEPRFRVNLANGGHRFYSYDQVIYVPAISIDGVCAVAPITLAREAIALLLLMERYASEVPRQAGR